MNDHRFMHRDINRDGHRNAVLNQPGNRYWKKRLRATFCTPAQKRTPSLDKNRVRMFHWSYGCRRGPRKTWRPSSVRRRSWQRSFGKDMFPFRRVK